MFSPAAATIAACRTILRKRAPSAATWSAGNIPITAAGSERRSRNAARPMAGAVLRPAGSAITCRAGSRRACRRISGRSSGLVMIQKLRAGASGARRATVCCSMVWRPSSASSCLARRRRDTGQKRVPFPPARITG
jgi:hypothetical protein